MDEETKKEIFSFPTLVGVLGTALGVWGVVAERALLIFLVLCGVMLVLFCYLLSTRKQYLAQRQLASDNSRQVVEITRALDDYRRGASRQIDEICKSFHQLTHRSREYVTALKTTPEGTDTVDELKSAMKMVLTTASGNFSEILGFKCTASVMMRSRENVFKTTWYCHNTAAQRESKPSTPLRPDEGLVARALNTKDAVFWKDTDDTFFPTRADHKKYYRSGVCVPIQKCFDYVGMFNLDSLELDAFDYKVHKELAEAYADMVGLILECDDAFGGRNGTA